MLLQHAHITTEMINRNYVHGFMKYSNICIRQLLPTRGNRTHEPMTYHGSFFFLKKEKKLSSCNLFVFLY
ncbi:hypothetical protein BDZ91DRAFT_726804 [Kalaharituber pfeilii]|nr:hypothetical protein BDZ91DRAFT_726804 [Kalaharituber pfeilii]